MSLGFPLFAPVAFAVAKTMNFQLKSCFFVRFWMLLSPKPAKSSLQSTQSFCDWFFGCRLKISVPDDDSYEILNDCNQNEASGRLRSGCQLYGYCGSDFGRPHHFLPPVDLKFYENHFIPLSFEFSLQNHWYFFIFGGKLVAEADLTYFRAARSRWKACELTKIHFGRSDKFSTWSLLLAFDCLNFGHSRFEGSKKLTS